MSHTHYKICPECQARAALSAPHCLTCRRKYNTKFTPTRAFQTLRLPFTAVITTPTKRDTAAALKICGAVLFALGAFCASRVLPTAPEHPGFVRAGDALWTDETLYLSAHREQTPTPIFVILGGSERYTAPNGQTFRAIKVRYLGNHGGAVWKPRDSIAQSDCYFVKKNDPALVRKHWDVLTD